MKPNHETVRDEPVTRLIYKGFFAVPIGSVAVSKKEWHYAKTKNTGETPWDSTKANYSRLR